jgi:drug/metabolite transporter (DMT)-like permease
MRVTDAGAASARWFAVGIPMGFVLLWSTGFVVARWSAPHSPPLVFLALRVAIAALVLALWAVLARAPWPQRKAIWHLTFAGMLVHGCYLAGVWVAISQGMPAGLTALIVNLQPVLTALTAPWWLGERQSARGWLGLFLGFAGVAMVVAHRVSIDHLALSSIVFSVIALVGITAGSLWQKRFVPQFDLRTGTCIQYVASFLILAPLAWLFEGVWPAWHPDLLGTMLWSVFALSIGAVFLMFMLMRRGEATRVASLFYLVPPVTALMAWALFREPFGLMAAFGMVVTAVGVSLVQVRSSAGSSARSK